MSDLLRRTIRQLPEQLAAARGLGTGDWTDLHTTIDYMAFAFQRAYPTLPCRDGCAHCCRTQLFRVTRAEWEPMQAALLADARLDALLDRVQRDFGAHREALEAAAEFWSAHATGLPPALEGVPVTCPLLEEERCMAYDARPAICRAYGSFGAKVGAREVYLMCQEHGPDFVSALAAEGHEAMLMAPWDPVNERLAHLNPSGAVAPLPLWLLRLADSRPAGSRQADSRSAPPP